MSIHRRIHDLRNQKNLTMQQLGDLCGVTWQTVQQWEKKDGTAPKRKRLETVAAALGVTPEYLLQGKTAETPLWPFSFISPEDYYDRLSDEQRSLVSMTVKPLIESLLAGADDGKKSEPPIAKSA